MRPIYAILDIYPDHAIQSVIMQNYFTNKKAALKAAKQSAQIVAKEHSKCHIEAEIEIDTDHNEITGYTVYNNNENIIEIFEVQTLTKYQGDN